MHHVISRIRYLRTDVAPPTTPLCVIQIAIRWRIIGITNITATLRTNYYNVGDFLTIMGHNIASQYFRTGVNMMLLMGNIYTNIIRLIEWWYSDEII